MASSFNPNPGQDATFPPTPATQARVGPHRDPAPRQDTPLAPLGPSLPIIRLGEELAPLSPGEGGEGARGVPCIDGTHVDEAMEHSCSSKGERIVRCCSFRSLANSILMYCYCILERRRRGLKCQRPRDVPAHRPLTHRPTHTRSAYGSTATSEW